MKVVAALGEAIIVGITVGEMGFVGVAGIVVGIIDAASCAFSIFLPTFIPKSKAARMDKMKMKKIVLFAI